MKRWLTRNWKVISVAIIALIIALYGLNWLKDRFIYGNTTFTIHGIVLDSATGKPLPNAEVQIRVSRQAKLPRLFSDGGLGNEERTVISGGDGRFVFKNLHGLYAYCGGAKLDGWMTDDVMNEPYTIFYAENSWNLSLNRRPTYAKPLPTYAKPYEIFMKPVVVKQGKK